MTCSVQPLGIADACRASLSATLLRDSLAWPAVGYARFAVDGPALQRQREVLTGMGCKSVFADALPGAATFRPELEQALAALMPGAVLLVDTLSSLTWREDDLREVWSRIRSAGAALVALTEGLDTRSSLDFADYCTVMSGFSASVRLARKIEGRVRRPDGRRRMTDAAWTKVRAAIESEGLSVTEAATQLGVRRSTVYRRLEAAPGGAG